MAVCVIDASTLLAVLFNEPGARDAGTWLEGEAAMSAVNWAEALTRARDRSRPREDWVGPLLALRSDAELIVVPFDEEQARATAALRDRTRLRGLSLGDRACLALASALQLPVVTADRVWADLEVDIRIEVFR